MFVTHSDFAQRVCQRLLSKLRVAPRSWQQSHVGKRLDSVLFQKRNKFLDRPRRMPDRPDSHASERRDYITFQATLMAERRYRVLLKPSGFAPVRCEDASHSERSFIRKCLMCGFRWC